MILRLIGVLFCVQAFVACERRPLEDEIGDLAFVPIHIDWSQSGLDVPKMHNASVWFFPHNGQQPIEHIAEESVTDTKVLLPEGIYSVVVFNEEVDFGWQSLQFEGSDSYSTFRVIARSGSNVKGMNSRIDNEDLRLSPDAIASWSMDRFEVSAEMVRATAKGSRAEQTDRSARISATPLPLTKSVKIKAYVQNLTSAKRCWGTLSGAVGGVLLSSGKAYTYNVLHDFILNDRAYDEDNPHNGYIHSNILIFNVITNTQNTLNVDFELHDGTFTPPYSFDVTDRVIPDEPEVEVVVGTEKDPPIILPEVHIDEDVTVDGWDENEVTIPVT